MTRVSLITAGLLLFGLLTFPLLAGTREAWDAYEKAVESVMTIEGEIPSESRAFLQQKKAELGLTDEEAAEIEEQVRQDAYPIGALEAYQQVVKEVMTIDGDITIEGRAFLDRTRRELGLTDEEAAEIEEHVRETGQARKSL